MPRHEAPPQEVVATPTPTPARAPAGPRTFTLIEDVFAEWGRYAVWENDLTEVALWNSNRNSYSDRYEVMRSGDNNYYFRSISQFTRPVMTHGQKPNSPLQFTETQALRDEWLHERNEITYRALSEAARENIPAPGAKPVVEPK